jgi:hypothetical protein
MRAAVVQDAYPQPAQPSFVSVKCRFELNLIFGLYSDSVTAICCVELSKLWTVELSSRQIIGFTPKQLSSRATTNLALRFRLRK